VSSVGSGAERRVAETVLHTEGLTKVYRSLLTPAGIKAVDGLNLTVRRGETYSIVGPNGSGKTTTLKILLGLIFPTAGDATIFGKSIADLGVRKRIGFLPEDAYLYDCFTGEELLNFYAELFGYSRKQRKQLVEELLGLVGMQENRRVPFRECSKGMRQRIALAQALVNDPELLILDEPTSGLDPAGRHQMTLLILELKRRGKTILLCSHFLAEVEEVCDRVGIMYRGSLIAEGSLGELAGEPEEIAITTRDLPAHGAERLAALPEVLGVADVGGGLAAPVGSGAERRAIVRLSRAAEPRLWSVLQTIHELGADIVEVRRPRPTLQDVFVRAIAAAPGAAPEAGGGAAREEEQQ
jgi:ABC-2 type transport system ATP-binding protein